MEVDYHQRRAKLERQLKDSLEQHPPVGGLKSLTLAFLLAGILLLLLLLVLVQHPLRLHKLVPRLSPPKMPVVCEDSLQPSGCRQAQSFPVRRLPNGWLLQAPAMPAPSLRLAARSNEH